MTSTAIHGSLMSSAARRCLLAVAVIFTAAPVTLFPASAAAQRPVGARTVDGTVTLQGGALERHALTISEKLHHGRGRVIPLRTTIRQHGLRNLG